MDWCIHNFSSVYLKEFPEKNIEILKYMSVIREAATRYPLNARVSYDQQFRQANELTRQSWESLNGELWLRVMSYPAQNNSMLKRSAESAPNNGQSKTCYAFNEGNCTWKMCRFNHVCTACNSAMHGQSNCLHIWQRSTDRLIRAMTYNLILFFEAGDTQEGAQCFEVTDDTIVDKQIEHTTT